MKRKLEVRKKKIRVKERILFGKNANGMATQAFAKGINMGRKGPSAGQQDNGRIEESVNP